MAARFDYLSGVDGTAIVPDDAIVVVVSCVSVAGGSFTIAPGGAGNAAPVTAGPAIPLPAGVPWDRDWPAGVDRSVMARLGGGTVFQFTSTDTYYVELAR